MLTEETRLRYTLSCRDSPSLCTDAAREHLKINRLITEPAEAKSVATVISGAKPHLKQHEWHVY